jgi:penicillin-binding protein 2
MTGIRGRIRSLFRRPLIGGVALLFLLAPGCGPGPGQALKNDALLEKAATDALAGRAGAVIVMDVKTGRIRAMVGRDIATRWAFPPGSLVKLVSVWKGIEERRISPETRFRCTGSAVISGTTYECWYPPGHGDLNLVRGIAYSCNLYFLSLAETLGADATHRGLSELGFGEKTGINLPQEETGRLFPPDPAFAREYVIGDTDNVTATPLQVIVYLSALVNGGSVWVPRVTPTEEDIGSFSPKLKKKVDVSRAAPILAEGMRDAAAYGTAVKGAPEGHEIMGKTGTGEFLGSSWATHAWFLGFAPVDNPEIAVVVFLYHGRGGEDAAPVAREVFRVYFGGGHTD